MDIQTSARINQIVKAMEKMHNGLTVLIAAHNNLTTGVEEMKRRVDKLEAELKELRDRLTE